MGGVHQQLFITPHFFQHFELEGIADPHALFFKLRFASAQLGFVIFNRKQEQNEHFENWVKFNCTFGQIDNGIRENVGHNSR